MPGRLKSGLRGGHDRRSGLGGCGRNGTCDRTETAPGAEAAAGGGGRRRGKGRNEGDGYDCPAGGTATAGSKCATRRAQPEGRETEVFKANPHQSVPFLVKGIPRTRYVQTSIPRQVQIGNQEHLDSRVWVALVRTPGHVATLPQALWARHGQPTVTALTVDIYPSGGPPHESTRHRRRTVINRQNDS